MDTRPIGIFDSGVGGLTVFSELKKQLPNEDMIYLGDTKNFPYGNKSKDTIIELSKKNINFLISKNVKLVVIACGTATSQALIEVKTIYNIPIIGIIEPTVISLSKENIKNIGVIATIGTIRSGAWEKEIKKYMPNVNVYSKACALLAQMAEEGWTNNKIAELTAREYLKDFDGKEIEKLILGCTHYPLFETVIKKALNKNVEIIDTGKKMGIYLKEILLKENLENTRNNIAQYEIYLTDHESEFVRVARALLKEEITPRLAV